MKTLSFIWQSVNFTAVYLFILGMCYFVLIPAMGDLSDFVVKAAHIGAVIASYRIAYFIVPATK